MDTRWLYRIGFAALFVAMVAAATTFGWVSTSGPGIVFYVVAGFLGLWVGWDFESRRKRRNEERPSATDEAGQSIERTHTDDINSGNPRK